MTLRRKISLLLVLTALTAGCTSQADVSPGITRMDVKAAVVEEIDPGTCYGMPGAVSDEMVQDHIESRPELAGYVRENYNLTDERQVYSRMKQFEAVTLNRTDSGYSFQVRDGNCCTITTVTGSVEPEAEGLNLTVENRSSRNVPC
ncbi:MAG: hypothetical protein SVQ76_00120 [Candidatus Nanohaloarchaea archaeon]|nr:hypothetical protein [Candidatus Nanohaloarchaea archaeon]